MMPLLKFFQWAGSSAHSIRSDKFIYVLYDLEWTSWVCLSLTRDVASVRYSLKVNTRWRWYQSTWSDLKGDLERPFGYSDSVFSIELWDSNGTRPNRAADGEKLTPWRVAYRMKTKMRRPFAKSCSLPCPWTRARGKFLLFCLRSWRSKLFQMLHLPRFLTDSFGYFLLTLPLVPVAARARFLLIKPALFSRTADICNQ